jgi:hypothetical protein
MGLFRKKARGIDSEAGRLAVFTTLLQQGWDQSAAGCVALAVMPLDDDYPASAAFTSEVTRLANAFAASPSSTNEISGKAKARETLLEYKALAAAHGERYYAQRYDQTLRSSSSPE